METTFAIIKPDAVEKKLAGQILARIESAGFTIDHHRENAYAFISDQARNASAEYGVKSISILATLTTD